MGDVTVRCKPGAWILGLEVEDRYTNVQGGLSAWNCMRVSHECHGFCSAPGPERMLALSENSGGEDDVLCVSVVHGLSMTDDDRHRSNYWSVGPTYCNKKQLTEGNWASPAGPWGERWRGA